jgi:hypothetical protein
MRRLTIMSGILAAAAALWSTYWIVAASFIEGEIELAFSRGAPGLETSVDQAVCRLSARGHLEHAGGHPDGREPKPHAPRH